MDDKVITGVYKITRKSTSQVYIGKSINILNRFKQHIRGNDNTKIDNALMKHGKDEFDFEILEDISHIKEPHIRDNYLNKLEKYYIEKYNSFENKHHYNLSIGGEGHGSNESHPLWIPLPKNEILKHLYNGLSSKEISQIYNINDTTIRNKLKYWLSSEEYSKYVNSSKHNSFEKNPNWKSIPKKEFIEKAHECHSFKELGSYFNISPSTAMNRCKLWFTPEEYKNYVHRNNSFNRSGSKNGRYGSKGKYVCEDNKKYLILPIENIIKDANNKMTIKELCIKYSTSRNTIRDRLMKHMDHEEYEKYVSYCRSIGGRYGLSKYTLWNPLITLYSRKDYTKRLKKGKSDEPFSYFSLKYNSKKINLGIRFLEWISIDIINELINDSIT